jgi:two-component system sensor histidine kinase YesM
MVGAAIVAEPEAIKLPINFFRDLRVTHKFIFSLIAVLVVPVGIAGIIVFKQIINSALSQAELVAERGVQQACQGVLEKMREIDRTSQLISVNRRILIFLESPFEWNPGSLEEYLDIYSPFIENLKFQEKSLNDLRIYVMEPTIPERWGSFYFLSRISSEGWYPTVESALSLGPFWRGAHAERVFRPTGETEGSKSVFSQYREMRSLSNDGRTGIIEAEIEVGELFSNLRAALPAEYGRTLVIDSGGRVVSDNIPGVFGTRVEPELRSVVARLAGVTRIEKVHGVDSIVASMPIDGLGCTIVGVYPTARFIDRVGSSLRLVFLVSVLSFVALGFIIYMVVSLLLKRLEMLVDAMRRVEDGDLRVGIPEDSRDEFGELARSFNSMIGRIETLIDSLSTTQLMEKEAELTALEAQINPHFLYNTLSTITWMAREAKVPVIADLSISLAKLYRTMLNKGKKLVTTREELDMLRAYITIQRIRFEGLYDVAFDIERGIEDFLIPKLVLQPIVENAFRHGLEPKTGPGSLLIRAQSDDGCLLFEVTDDGVGMPEELVHMINEGKIERTQGSGYAIKNINERISLRYGERFGITVSSKEGAGTTVRILVPQMADASGASHV